jgi:hypothetical protein
VTRKRSKTGRTARKRRRVSLRENAKATGILYKTADIDSALKRDRRLVLKLASSRLDDVELDSAWEAALRGDYVVASDRLTRTIKQAHVHQRVKKPKGWSPWRNALLPRKVK